MSDPRHVNMPRGDTGVDRSVTDNSTRETNDDHSVDNSEVVDNSTHTNTTTTNSDSRDQSRRSRWTWTWKSADVKVGNIHIGAAPMMFFVLAVVMLAAYLLATLVVVMRDVPPARQPVEPVVDQPPPVTVSPTLPPEGMVWVPPNQAATGEAAITTRFAIDLGEVSTSAFASFVATHPEWRRDRLPASAHDGDYLKDWPDASSPVGGGGESVDYVTQHAAAAFCRSRGARLPTEQEWEYAAKVAPAGLRNMVGSLWEWTSTAAPIGDASRYVVRGGGRLGPPELVSVDARQFLGPAVTAPDLGFRCVQ